MDNGLDEIENVREEYKEMYEICNVITQVKLKCWLNHSESRHRNGNKPFTFNNYTNHMRYANSYIEQIRLGMIDVSDIGDNEAVIEYIKNNFH